MRWCSLLAWRFARASPSRRILSAPALSRPLARSIHSGTSGPGPPYSTGIPGITLTTAGLIHRFDGRLFSAEDVGRGKPAPDLFLHAAATLGVDPSRCAVVEDAPAGLEAAAAAGMTAFGYCALTPRRLLAHAPGGLVDDMAQMADLLLGPDS